jgi:hypothetical protein
VALAGLSGGRAQAAATLGPTIELSVIAATSTDGGASIDPQIHDLPHSEQPFARYNVFRLLDRRQFHLEAAHPITYGLVNGRTVQVVLEGVSDGGPRRYQLQTQIRDPGNGDFLKGLHVTASENQAFFVGGQSYQGGTLFLELVVRP